MKNISLDDIKNSGKKLKIGMIYPVVRIRLLLHTNYYIYSFIFISKYLLWLFCYVIYFNHFDFIDCSW